VGRHSVWDRTTPGHVVMIRRYVAMGTEATFRSRCVADRRTGLLARVASYRIGLG
jgi:hypothetical protein